MLKGTIELSSITSTGVSSVTVPASTATTAERVSASIRLLCAEGPGTPHGSQTFRIIVTDFVNVESAVVFSDDLGGKFPYNGRWSCGISKSLGRGRQPLWLFVRLIGVSHSVPGPQSGFGFVRRNPGFREIGSLLAKGISA